MRDILGFETWLSPYCHEDSVGAINRYTLFGRRVKPRLLYKVVNPQAPHIFLVHRRVFLGEAENVMWQVNSQQKVKVSGWVKITLQPRLHLIAVT